MNKTLRFGIEDPDTDIAMYTALEFGYCRKHDTLVYNQCEVLDLINQLLESCYLLNVWPFEGLHEKFPHLIWDYFPSLEESQIESIVQKDFIWSIGIDSIVTATNPQKKIAQAILYVDVCKENAKQNMSLRDQLLTDPRIRPVSMFD